MKEIISPTRRCCEGRDRADCDATVGLGNARSARLLRICALARAHRTRERRVRVLRTQVRVRRPQCQHRTGSTSAGVTPRVGLGIEHRLGRGRECDGLVLGRLPNQLT